MEKSPSSGPKLYSVTQEIPLFHVTQKFIIVILKHFHWSLPRTTSIQSTPAILFLTGLFQFFPHLRPGLTSGLFPLGFPTKTTTHFPFSPHVPHALPNLFFRFDYPNNIWQEVQIMKRLIMPPSIVSYFLVPLNLRLFTVKYYMKARLGTHRLYNNCLNQTDKR
jgi:hypothetical protein